MEIIAGIVTLLAAIMGVVGVYTRRKAAAEAHPEIEYESASREPADGEPWRWRQPRRKLGLELEDTETASRIRFPFSPELSELVISGLGYLCMAGVVWLTGAGLYRLATTKVTGEGVALLVMGVLFVGFIPAIMIQVGTRVVAIERRPDQLILELRWGYFWTRHVTIQRDPKWRFEGKLQSSLEMTSDQDAPQYKLYLKTPGLFGKKKRFIVQCDQSQGSWIVGGLQEWNEAG